MLVEVAMEFNKELFADLLQRARGDRSINRFGSEADVDPGYISRLLRTQVETPPGAAVLTKIAGNAAHGVTIEQLLGAAGYINFPRLDIIIGDGDNRAPLKNSAAKLPENSSATGIYEDGTPAATRRYDDGRNPDSGAADDSMVEELLSFCKEMMERPILLDTFKQVKDLSDDKLRRVLKMIKMIAEMGD
jgi:transcriptional regulator with XRE-family HTH domain